MQFEWDDEKSHMNMSKHGIDFDTAKALWDDPNRVEIHTPYPIENRNILIGKILENPENLEQYKPEDEKHKNFI